MRLAEIAAICGGRIEGDPQAEIFGISDLAGATAGEISFLANPRYSHLLASTKAAAVILAEDFGDSRPEGVSFVRAADPYLAMAKVSAAFHQAPRFEKAVSSLAFVHPSARCADDVSIFPFAYVSAAASIGPRSVLMPGCFVGEAARIGADCLLYSNVSVREKCVIGNRVIIHCGAVIGSDGFGFAPSPEGHFKIPQVGNVIVGDDVEIGANTTIDRATFGSTAIGAGTKIDNLVQIAHNVEMGRHCFVAAQTGMSGSTKVGDFVAMGGQVGLAGHIKIGDGARIGAQSGVVGDIPAGATFSGYPAIPHEEWRHNCALIRRLDRMKEKITELEAAVRGLSENG